METDRKKHWENIYQTKELTTVSWYQPVPESALRLLRKTGLPSTAAIIDIGGGDSLLADHLLDRGYSNITVLDISERALERARLRLGSRADAVTWIVADITTFDPRITYDFWYDRAVFHFLTNDADVECYRQNAAKGVSTGGTAVIGTFSENGPLKCSGIPIRQYTTETLGRVMEPDFETIRVFTELHQTPFETRQEFVFGCFRKK